MRFMRIGIELIERELSKNTFFSATNSLNLTGDK